MDKDEKDLQLKKYAESWIVVVTVILSISFVIIYYASPTPPKNPGLAPILGYVAIMTIIIEGASLAIFLLARDPRQSLSTSKLIDAGVFCFIFSIIIGAIGWGAKEFYLNDDATFSIYLSVTFVALAGMFLGIYFKKRKNDTN